MIRIASVIKESTVDGEGWRYVIFTQGCNHNCKGCQNPQTHDFNGGTLVTEDELFDGLTENPLLDGITLSGGDPFFQAKELLPLVKRCKENNINIWTYTGFEFEQFLKFKNNENCDKRVNFDMIELLEYIDVVVDGRFILEQRTLEKPFVGSENQRLIDCQATLERNEVTLYKL